MAWLFNLKHKRDPVTGQELPVPLDQSNSLLIIKPDPFQMEFEPRSEKKKMEALRIWKESEAKDRAKREQWLRNLGEGKPNVIKEPKVPQSTVKIPSHSPAAAVPVVLVNGHETNESLEEVVMEKAVVDLRKEAGIRIKIARLDSTASV